MRYYMNEAEWEELNRLLDEPPKPNPRLRALLTTPSVFDTVAPPTTDRELILKFVSGLAYADHMGDVAEDVGELLTRLGVDVEWEDLYDLAKKLKVGTLHSDYDPRHFADEDDAEETDDA